MQLPQGIHGWTVFVTGLLIVAYRIHGIDSPRTWIEWVERQFVYMVNLRIIGAFLLAAAAGLGYFGGLQQTVIGNLFVLSVTILGITGIGLVGFQNHLRHVMFATAESSDARIRIASIIVTLLGLGLMIAPFYFT